MKCADKMMSNIITSDIARLLSSMFWQQMSCTSLTEALVHGLLSSSVFGTPSEEPKFPQRILCGHDRMFTIWRWSKALKVVQQITAIVNENGKKCSSVLWLPSALNLCSTLYSHCSWDLWAVIVIENDKLVTQIIKFQLQHWQWETWRRTLQYWQSVIFSSVQLQNHNFTKN